MKRIVVSLLLAVLLSGSTSSPALGAPSDYAFKSATAELSTLEAGAHPDLTTGFELATDPSSQPDDFGTRKPYARTKDVVISLPPGLLGSLNAVTLCTAAQFVTAEEAEGCPFASQVGTVDLLAFGNIRKRVALYNIEAGGPDEVARLGFYAQTTPTFVSVRVRTETQDDYGLTSETSNIFSGVPVVNAKVVIWGVPADSSHDRFRLTNSESGRGERFESPPRPFGRAPAPFLTNPTTCGRPLAVGFKVDSYAEPGAWREESVPLGEIEGCPELSFDPSLSLTPTNREAAAPSGIDATLSIPQNEEVNGRATSQLRNTVIRLPEGLGISPGAAEGLAGCSVEEVGIGRIEPAHCPDASKIATVEIDSPSLTRTVNGALYQRTPEPGHLTRAWLVADELGIHVKLPGEFLLDPQTGRITSLFLETPQVPVREFRLHFKGGANGVLATPRSCGTYLTEYAFTPWSGNGDAVGSAPMTFDLNCGTGGFSPALTAGTVNPSAGAFTTLVTDIVQGSGEQNISQLRVTMPQGVLAKLSGVAVCSDAAAASGSCPVGSLIGRTAVASGPGPNPLWIPQPGKEPTAVYLAGPYNGGPYSLVVKTPAQAGPFDLGDVIVRVALRIDPDSAQVTAVSDPLPQILEGIPISYRRVHLEIDRPEFALNPTNCQPMAASGEAISAEGAHASLSTRFQAANCAALPFKPKLRLALKGATKRAGDPALSATLTMPPGGANIAYTRVTLPGGEAIDNAHVNNPCTRVQFNAGACPRSSVLGTARAFTPLLDQPLEGPVYFRSNGGERQLPDVVADLRGPIHVVLVGFIDSKKGRIRNTFASVPDAPVTKFTLKLYGGKRGLLENDRNICRSPNRAIFQFTGQNGKAVRTTPLVAVPSCKKKRKSSTRRR